MKKILNLCCTAILTCTLIQPIYASDIQACDPTETCEESSSKEENNFKEISMDDALALFKEKKSAILFFGYSTCPYCQQARPVLEKAAKKEKKSVYYVRVRDDDKNLLYTEEQRKKLTKYIKKYMTRNKDEDNKYWLYVPLIVSLKKGKAVDGHESTVKNHDASKRQMTKQEKKRLENRYIKLMQKK